MFIHLFLESNLDRVVMIQNIFGKDIFCILFIMKDSESMTRKRVNSISGMLFSQVFRKIMRLHFSTSLETII